MTKPRIVRDPLVVGGEWRLDGTRLTTEFFYDNVRRSGRDYVKEGWPYLTDDDIDTALAFERRPSRRLRRMVLAAKARICRLVCEGVCE